MAKKNYDNPIHGADDIRARRALMVWDRLHGMPLKNLQEKYQLSESQTNRQLEKARKEGLMKRIEDEILAKLAPKALNLYDKALEDGDLFVAKDILNHSSKIADRQEKKQQHQEGMSFQLWDALRKAKKLQEGIDEPITVDIDPPIEGTTLIGTGLGEDRPVPCELPSEIQTLLSAPVGEINKEVAAKYLIPSPKRDRPDSTE